VIDPIKHMAQHDGLRYHFELFEALENDAPRDTRLAVISRTNEVLQQLCRQDPGNALW
jgi:hypothetical protein